MWRRIIVIIRNRIRSYVQTKSTNYPEKRNFSTDAKCVVFLFLFVNTLEGKRYLKEAQKSLSV